ncbi:related to transcription factor jumonji [Fusarium oxysporum]|uniref:Related to transcription factor jumonji n=1 Tax=Fusarium oxysporum TaxID=5507 RepID=A0A2H3T8G7_FUSOX|nr:related to transcription factor jumonji [Fusarium oxysporum]
MEIQHPPHEFAEPVLHFQHSSHLEPAPAPAPGPGPLPTTKSLDEQRPIPAKTQQNVIEPQYPQTSQLITDQDIITNGPSPLGQVPSLSPDLDEDDASSILSDLPSELDEPVAETDPIDFDWDGPEGHQVLRLKPTVEQWNDFPANLAFARSLKAESHGCFKIVLPEELIEDLPAKDSQKVPANAYRPTQIKRNSFWRVDTVPSVGSFNSSVTGTKCNVTAIKAIDQLRKLYRKNDHKQIRNVRYRVDVPAWTPEQRLEAGVPERSPIYPLKGDKLDNTKAIIPGIHTPYVYESGPHFGASFQIHAEDFRLVSLNHLYKGRKIWIVVPSTAVDVAEEALGRKDKCSQFMRHRAEFFFPQKLEKLGIPFRIIDQRPGETIVILPDAYHEGFSTGYTIAEAKNYADDAWTTNTYQPCEAKCQLATAIPADLLRPLQEGETQLDLCAGFDLTAEQESPPSTPAPEKTKRRFEDDGQSVGNTKRAKV